jgi:hypothetical protein
MEGRRKLELEAGVILSYIYKLKEAMPVKLTSDTEWPPSTWQSQGSKKKDLGSIFLPILVELTYVNRYASKYGIIGAPHAFPAASHWQLDIFFSLCTFVM